MMLLAVGCSYRTAPVELRERLAFAEERLAGAHQALSDRFDCEAVILSTCNRVELYLGRVLDGRPAGGEPLEGAAVASFLADYHGLAAAQLRPQLYTHCQAMPCSIYSVSPPAWIA
jgi:glutamyl-tRNA reductase